MTRVTTLIAALTAATALSATAVTAQDMQPLDFDEVTVIENAVGTQTFTSDGQPFGTVIEADVDANVADFVVETAEAGNYIREEVEVSAEEGTVAMGNNGLVFMISNDEMQSRITKSREVAATPRVELIDE